MNRLKHRIEISLLGGVCITATLTLLSSCAIRLFPNRDLPMMPKPFFLFTLMPGIIFGELFSGWLRPTAFYVANSAAYALLSFGATEIIWVLRRRNRRPSGLIQGRTDTIRP